MELITKTPGVCGGDACVKGTRIPVWIIVKRFRMGEGLNRIRVGFSGSLLEYQDVEAALRYAFENFAEIEANIAENE